MNINESSNYWESHLPFGGRSGTASGIGRVGGAAPMEAFTELQTSSLVVTLTTSSSSAAARPAARSPTG